jgi:hypothetical protein
MTDPTDRPELTPPEVGTPVVCMVCAHEKPWGVWSPQGAAVCIECRDKARASPSPDGGQGGIESWILLTVQCATVLEALHATESDGTALCQTVKDGIAKAVHAVREKLAGRVKNWPAAQPAEPSERELPTRWGHWVRNGEHYWVYGKGPMFHIQRLNTDTGLPHEDTADFAITLNSAGLRGHWRPAVPDDAAYADAAKLVEEILGTDKLTYLQLCAERDRLRDGWIASNELVEHLRAEQKAWQAAMDQVRKLRVKQRPERTDWDRDDPDGH